MIFSGRDALILLPKVLLSRFTANLIPLILFTFDDALLVVMMMTIMSKRSVQTEQDVIKSLFERLKSVRADEKKDNVITLKITSTIITA